MPTGLRLSVFFRDQGALRSKKTSQQVAHETTNGVHCKDIQGVVHTKHILELRGVVASSGTDNSKDEGSPRCHETRAWRDGNETCDDTGAETDGRPLPLQSVIHDAPGDTTHGGSQVRDNGCHDSPQVGAQSRAGIEPEPTNPEEDGTNDDVCDVVRAVVELVGAMSATLAEHQRVCQCSRAGGNVDGSTTCEVKSTQFVHPAGRVPCPAGNWIVDNGGPNEAKDHARQHATAFRDCTNSKGNPISVISYQS